MKLAIFDFITSVILLSYGFGVAVSQEVRGPTKESPKKANTTQHRVLYSSPECQNEILQYCPRAKNPMGDVKVLQCIHNNLPDLNILTKECQNLMYSVKMDFTINLNVNNIPEKACQEDLKQIPECTEENGKHMSTCLIMHQKTLKEASCLQFIETVAPLMFTDYRLIKNFVTDCQTDIEALKCGRLEKNYESGHIQQGSTIACLQSKFRELKESPKCQKQIVRITEMQSNDFHLDRTLYFACLEDRERFCTDTPSGSGRVYKCLIRNKFQMQMSAECRKQLTKRQIINNENIQTDGSFYDVCKRDVDLHKCIGDDTLQTGINDLTITSVMLCLENAEKKGATIQSNCKAEMIDHRRMLMQDYKLSPNIVKYCQEEIMTSCNGGLERNGKTLHCLFGLAKNSNKDETKIKPECFVQLKMFMKAVNPAENARIDPSLYEACHSLLEQGVCRDLRGGHGRVVQCLTRQLGTANMNEECSERLLEIQFFVARDWTLNSEFYDACKADASRFCNAPDEWYDNKNLVQAKQRVLPCLYHYLPDLEEENDQENYVSRECGIVVRQVMLKRAKSIDLQPEVQDACGYFLAKHCSSGQISEKGEEIRCLQKNLESLDEACQKEVLAITQTQNQDIRLDQILYAACLPTIEKYCPNKRDEKGALLECLIKQKNNDEMHEKCRVGIEHHQLFNLNDVTLNERFMKRCKHEIADLCPNKENKLEVVFCLSEIVLNDTLLNSPRRVTPRCKDQLRFELLQASENINLDPELAKACKSDIGSVCENVQSGKGNLIECLRTNEAKLSTHCRQKLFLRERIESLDEKADYGLNSHCMPAIKEFCHVDSTVSIVDCLRKHLNEVTLSKKCRNIVINRIVTQNKDVRLNPSLYKSCRKDINRQCGDIFRTNQDTTLNGMVLKCLKTNFVRNQLSNACSIEIGEIMREAATVDFRLDPMLAEGCMLELEALCSEEPNDSKEQCLRLKFQQMSIPKETRCYKEVKRIIIEGAADIFVDHELSQVCENDLNRYCGDVPPGSAQHLKCLIDAKENNKAKFSSRCAAALTSRRELWNLAKVNDELSGLNDLAYLIHVSRSRNYLFFSLMLVFFFIFLLGFVCRPIVFRARADKLK